MGYLRLFFKVKSLVHTISGRIKNGWDQKLFGLGLHDLLYPVALYTKSGGTGRSDRLPVGQFMAAVFNVVIEKAYKWYAWFIKSNASQIMTELK